LQESTSFLRPIVERCLPEFPPADLEIVEIEEGNTNHCFKVRSVASNENLLFLKHAKPTTRRGGGELSVSRMKYEAVGMQAYSKVAASVVPTVLAYDESLHILALQCIPDKFEVLQKLLERGEGVDVDISRIVGTIMGRSHSRSHELLVTEQQTVKYKASFSNPDALELWRAKLFEPTLELLDQRPPAGLAPQRCRAAVTQLLETFLSRKEALVHGDLHCGNLLVCPDEGQPLDERCKVVDFERCCLGPAGLDLGMYLSGLLVYYVGHSSPAVRRTLRDGILATLEAYRASFRVQAQSMLQAGEGGGGGVGAARADALEMSLARILNDAVGFMALYPLFLLCTKPEINIFSLESTPGYRWGDVAGREAFVRQRHMSVLDQALAQYLDGLGPGDGTQSAQARQQRAIDGIMSLISSDDARLLEHPTEFWF